MLVPYCFLLHCCWSGNWLTECKPRQRTIVMCSGLVHCRVVFQGPLQTTFNLVPSFLFSMTALHFPLYKIPTVIWTKHQEDPPLILLILYMLTPHLSFLLHYWTWNLPSIVLFSNQDLFPSIVNVDIKLSNWNYPYMFMRFK